VELESRRLAAAVVIFFSILRPSRGSTFFCLCPPYGEKQHVLDSAG
jgi:hypothetical protein